MPQEKLHEHVLKVVASAVATAIVGGVVKSHFTHDPGVPKKLFCGKENKLTIHVAVSLSDAEMLHGEVEKSNQQKIIKILKRANPLSRKPYMCQDCGNLKWV